MAVADAEITVAGYNANHLYITGEDFHHGPLTGEPRFRQVEDIINKINPDVLLTQEIFARNQAEAEDNIHRLAEATGLNCDLWNGTGTTTTVIKSNTHRLANGVLWRPGIQPLEWETAVGFWHGFGLLKAIINGAEVSYGCYHGQPAGLHEWGDTRSPEGEEIVKLVGAQNPDAFVVIEGDWNGMSADKVNGAYYDERTVFRGGFEDENTFEAFRRFVLSREAGEILRDGGLVDVAAAMPGAKPETKINTEPATDKEAARRNDIFRVSETVMPHVTHYGVIISKQTAIASDHFPTVLKHTLPTCKA